MLRACSAACRNKERPSDRLPPPAAIELFPLVKAQRVNAVTMRQCIRLLVLLWLLHVSLSKNAQEEYHSFDLEFTTNN